ncbi:MAG: NAD(P)-binding protein, partial [Sphingomonas sp.]|nr:NAD(P)-binding protein [Sphingomonas sp.]
MTNLIILGGGLAGGLCALALKHRRPDLSVTLVDRGETLGGNHVWSFFDSDIAPEDRHLVNPFVVQRWVCNAVRFPAMKRTFDAAYNSMTSERFDRELKARLDPDQIVTGNVIHATPTTVRMEGGVQLEAAAVLDARGLTEPRSTAIPSSIWSAIRRRQSRCSSWVLSGMPDSAFSALFK